MNFRVDVIIVGDSKSGHDILDKLAKSNPNINVAFISQAFKSTTAHDYANVKYFKDEVKYVSYRHRLFCCYMNNGDNIFGTHLVVASGLKHEPLVINNKQVPCVFNNIDDVSNLAKDQAALVVCNQESDAKLAVEVAKKYKHAYICTKELNLTESLSAATAKKLNKAENITVLHNASIKNTISDSGVLQMVELDNYSEIACSAIYLKNDSAPAIDFIPRKIISRDGAYPIVRDNCESYLVPGCFVVGTCLKKYTKAMEQKIVESILRDF